MLAIKHVGNIRLISTQVRNVINCAKISTNSYYSNTLIKHNPTRTYNDNLKNSFKNGNSLIYGDETLLTEACKHGNIKIINKLLRSGVDVNEPNKNGIRPLAMACKHSNTISSLETVNLLLNCDVSDDSVHEALLTSSYYSGSFSCVDTVELLISSKFINIDVNCTNNIGSSPLMLACTANFDTVNLLLEYYADVNQENIYGYTPLMMACIHNYKEDSLNIVKLLLESGADVNVADKWGYTPFMMAHDNATTKDLSLIHI